MEEDYLSRSEIIVLCDERIAEHDKTVNKPQHNENQIILKALIAQVTGLDRLLIKMEAQQSMVMKFAGAGIIIWSIKQIVDLAHSLIH